MDPHHHNYVFLVLMFPTSEFLFILSPILPQSAEAPSPSPLLYLPTWWH